MEEKIKLNTPPILGKLTTLCLCDWSNEAEVRADLVGQYSAKQEEVDRFDILVAYQDDGSWEGSSFLLLRERATGNFFENHASHCSCYGFEDQFDPEPTTLEYLKSDKFTSRNACDADVKKWIAENL